MYSHILISTDGSEVSHKGVEHGLELAKALGAQATIITVTEPFPFYSSGFGYDYSINETTLEDHAEGQRASAAAILKVASELAERHGVSVDTLHVPDAQVADSILSTAKSRNSGLIVMASHGRRGLGRLVLGSKTSEVLNRTEIPVLVVR